MRGLPDSVDRIDVKFVWQDPQIVTLGTTDVLHGSEKISIDPRETMWYEHPERESSGIDIVAVPIDMPSGIEFRPWEMISGQEVATGFPLADIEVGSDLFIVGHPLEHSRDVYPIWKRATVASEPRIDFEGGPCFLVDARTSSGMSGSPVYHVFDRRLEEFIETTRDSIEMLANADIYGSRSPVESPTWGFEPGIDFPLVGVYSGRVTDGENDLDPIGLGKVWKFDALQTVMRLPHPPTSTFAPGS